jgi:hypothetical protein
VIAADSLAEIEARANAATDGPWTFQHWGGQNQNGDFAESILFDSWGESLAEALPDVDGEFIAHARTDVPALVAALQAVLAQCDRHESIGAFTDYEVGRKYVAGCVRRAIENAIGATQ